MNTIDRLAVGAPLLPGIPTRLPAAGVAQPERRHRRRATAGMVFAGGGLAVMLSLPVAAASSLETFVLTIGGQADASIPNCAIGSLPPEHTRLFGDSSGVFVTKASLATCGVGGQYSKQTVAAGTLADSTSLNVNFGGNNFTGTASANAQYGKLGANTTATFRGSFSGLIYEGADAYSMVTETMVITSPSLANGSGGTIKFTFTVDGSLSSTGTGTADFGVSYGINQFPGISLIHGQTNNAIATPTLIVGTGNSAAGFTLAPGSINGAAALSTLALPIVFGTGFDFTFGLQTYAIPGPGVTMNVDFFSTALLTGIQVFNALGQPVDDFSIESGSGTRYAANGVELAPVPIPAAAWLLGSAFTGLIMYGRRAPRTGSCAR